MKNLLHLFTVFKFICHVSSLFVEKFNLWRELNSFEAKNLCLLQNFYVSVESYFSFLQVIGLKLIFPSS